MSVYLSSVFGAGAQLFSNQGVVLAGGKINTYLAGTTTPATTYTTSAGNVPNSNPIVLDSAGRVTTAIWLTGGVSYKFIVTDSVGGSVGPTLDNISGVGDPGLGGGLAQWLSSGFTPAYSTGSQFTTVGDSTSVFTAGRRLKSSVTAGTAYSTVISSTFGAGSTTVVVGNDSTPLDSGMSAVQVGIITALSGSGTIALPYRPAFYFTTAATITAPSTNGTFTTYSVQWYDTLSNFNNTTGTFTATIPGIYLFVARVTYINGSANQGTFSLNAGSYGNRVASPNPTVASTQYEMVTTVLAKMQAGEGASVIYQVGAGTPTAICSSFGGLLVG
jgi:hypothetical protein